MTFYGTSAASASVGGALALLKEGFPKITDVAAQEAIQSTATDKGPAVSLLTDIKTIPIYCILI